MKFYIATGLERIKEHNQLRDLLVAEGHEITYDWSLHGGSVKHVSIERLREVAERELLAVEEADILVVLLPGGKGTHTELGAAHAMNKPVIIHNHDSTPFELGDATCAFYHLPNVTYLAGDISSIIEEVNLCLAKN